MSYIVIKDKANMSQRAVIDVRVNDRMLHTLLAYS